MGYDVKILGGDEVALFKHRARGLLDHELRESWASALLQEGAYLTAVALTQAKAPLMVGFASGVIHLHPDKKPDFYVDEVSVARRFRRQGIATALLKLLLKRAAERGCVAAWLLTTADNVGARAFYRDLGMDEAQQPLRLYSLDL